MTGTLYELASLRDVIDRALEATDGELTDELAAALDLWEEKFSDKIESIALYICDLEADATAIKAEEDKLAARRKAKLSRCAWLEKYALEAMQRVAKPKIQGVLKTVSVKKSAAVHEIVPTTSEELGQLAEHYPDFVRHVPESWAWAKDAIKEAAKAKVLPEEIGRRVAVKDNLSLSIR